MLQRIKSYYWVVVLLLLSFVMTGCFQSMSSDPDTPLESLPIAVESQPPTWTPLPTYTSFPTFTPQPTMDATQFSAVELNPENSSDPQLPQVEVIDQFEDPLATPTTSLEGIDPAFLTATYIVAQATFQIQTLTATWTIQETPLPIFTATIDPTFGQVPAPVVPVPGANCIYQVRTGDNLWQISQTFGVFMADIANASGIAVQSLLLPGQDLTIPQCGTTGAIPPPTMTPRFITQTSQPVTVPNTAVVPFTLPPPNCNTAGGITHTVSQGETLFSIAQRYGSSVECIMSANSNIVNPSQILVSDQIFIP